MTRFELAAHQDFLAPPLKNFGGGCSTAKRRGPWCNNRITLFAVTIFFYQKRNSSKKRETKKSQLDFLAHECLSWKKKVFLVEKKKEKSNQLWALLKKKTWLNVWIGEEMFADGVGMRCVFIIFAVFKNIHVHHFLQCLKTFMLIIFCSVITFCSSLQQCYSIH